MSKTKISRDFLLERTTDTEVFQDMDNFELLNDSGQFALSIRLQFPKFSKGFVASDFEPFVDTYIGSDNLASLGRLSFPNEWQMELKDRLIRERLIRMGRTKINTRTCWIAPLSQSEVRGFIHWIPSAVPDEKLRGILTAFGELLLMENQRQTKWKTKVECESRYFGLYLKSGKTMDDLPHFIKIDEYYGLITIRGRTPSCFHCKQVGHKKTECKTFREKISDYCSRPAGLGVPRFKPRGKRFKKHIKPKLVSQEVQTDTTCSECIRERLAAEAARAEANAAAGDEASDAKDNSDVEVVDMMQLTVEDTVKPGFWRRVRVEKKRLKLAKEEELLAQFREKVKEICQGPIQEFSNLNLSLSVTGDNEGEVEGIASCGQSGSIGQDHPLSTSEQESAVEKDCGTEARAVALGPVEQIEQLRMNIEDVLNATRERLECQFEAAKQVLLAQAAGKPSSGKKKRKRKRQKKQKASVELQVDDEEPKDV